MTRNFLEHFQKYCHLIFIRMKIIAFVLNLIDDDMLIDRYCHLNNAEYQNLIPKTNRLCIDRNINALRITVVNVMDMLQNIVKIFSTNFSL